MNTRSVFAFTAVLATAIAGGQQVPPQWSSAGSFIGGGLVRGSDGNYYRALHNSTNKDPTKDGHVNWELYYVRVPVTLPVAMSGARFSSVKQAWAFVASAHIAATASANISVTGGSGTYLENFTAPLNLNHENGDQVTITGDGAAKVTLKFASGIDGIGLHAGHRFAGLSGLTIDGTTKTTSGNGISVGDHSSLGPSAVTIKNFHNGLEVYADSHANCSGSVISAFYSTGADVRDGSFVNLSSAQIDGTGAGLTGISATLSATINAESSAVSNVTTHGFIASQGSFIDAGGASATSTGTAYQAGVRSTIDASGSVCSSNAFGYYAYASSYMRVFNNVVTSTPTAYSPPLNTQSSDMSLING